MYGRAVRSAECPAAGPRAPRRPGAAAEKRTRFCASLHRRTKRSVCVVGGVLTCSPIAMIAPLIGCGGTQGPIPFLPSQAPAPVPNPGDVNASGASATRWCNLGATNRSSGCGILGGPHGGASNHIAYPKHSRGFPPFPCGSAWEPMYSPVLPLCGRRGRPIKKRRWEGRLAPEWSTVHRFRHGGATRFEASSDQVSPSRPPAPLSPLPDEP